MIFVPSYVRLGTARGPRLAFAWHMAEGGGTVGYLAKTNPNGVSVHYVVEYSGRVVQMLRLNEMHSSLRASAIRMTDDADGFYGRSAAKRVLGAWADTARSLGPNHATIGVEVEGFAAAGPNEKQRLAIGNLYRLVRADFPGIQSLGHRDFASYKGCPGRKFPWAAVGGHAMGATLPDTSTNDPQGAEMPGLSIDIIDGPNQRGVLRFTKATPAQRIVDQAPVTIPAGAVRRAYAQVRRANGSGWLFENGNTLHFVGMSVAPPITAWPEVENIHPVTINELTANEVNQVLDRASDAIDALRR